MRGEADDPLRRRLDRDRRTFVVGDGDRSRCRHRRERDNRDQRDTDRSQRRHRNPAKIVAPPVEKSAASW